MTLFFDEERIGATVANGGGSLVVELAVPRSAARGDHTLEAVGQWSGVTVRTVFVVEISRTQPT